MFVSIVDCLGPVDMNPTTHNKNMPLCLTQSRFLGSPANHLLAVDPRNAIGKYVCRLWSSETSCDRTNQNDTFTKYLSNRKSKLYHAFLIVFFVYVHLLHIRWGCAPVFVKLNLPPSTAHTTSVQRC